ncbi:anti-sigma B factor RsbW [Bacillus sp. Marseille-P3661]|uniref:anti-sigma B factor RsbW n=1 Tax=Bacillus sp. Marseille-P3661 TaxID=1936234 RepID=UPI000C8264C1|nr:anti-sigma B factor RsbW [Bacillus sp. Marseille-P3661]
MKKSFDFIEMKIPAKSEYVGVIRLTVSGIASRMGFTYDEIEDIKVAISEATTNAIQHAYHESEEGEVVLGFVVHHARLEIIVADNGKSFNLNDISHNNGPYDRATPIENMREGGLGLYLIETLMDDVSFNNQAGGVVLVMTKHLSRDEVDPGDDTVSSSQS